MLPAKDGQFVQIVDAAFADAARRSGPLLVCRPGCTQCCHGVFEITLLDAARLQAGLTALREHDPLRADRVLHRAKQSVERHAAEFPGDLDTGILDEDEDSEQRFEQYANDEPCPALDPETGTCDLYNARPITCRVFGPPIRDDRGGLGVCELCYHGATDEQIASCEMVPDPDDLESQLVVDVEDRAALEGYTIVAYALTRELKDR
ncbi:MAG TPA: YkgJ family cysteine cluster protein [Candidatus Koribacter sp.]|jgi:Fe-S-cluster containining protein